MSRGGWMREEDRLLLQLVHEKGFAWRTIAKSFVERSEDSLRNRFKRLTGCDVYMHKRNRTTQRRRWTTDESQFLTTSVLSTGRIDFDCVCNVLQRDVQQVRNRWARMCINPYMCADIVVCTSQEVGNLISILDKMCEAGVVH